MCLSKRVLKVLSKLELSPSPRECVESEAALTSLATCLQPYHPCPLFRARAPSPLASPCAWGRWLWKGCSWERSPCLLSRPGGCIAATQQGCCHPARLLPIVSAAPWPPATSKAYSHCHHFSFPVLAPTPGFCCFFSPAP